MHRPNAARARRPAPPPAGAPKSPPPRRRAPGTRPRVPAARPAPPRAASEAPVEPAARCDEPPARALAALPERCDFDRVDSTAMFHTLGGIRALPAEEVSRAIARCSLADARGYQRDDLFAIAEVGYQYVRSGGHRLAKVIFEGLVAVAPEEPYFWLALGHVQDHLDDKAAARAAFETTARLDRRDATPEINLAELELEAGDRRAAARRLQTAVTKARAARQDELSRKAAALLGLIAR